MTVELRPAASTDEYCAGPVGRYYAGRTFYHFFSAADVSGLVLWGRPDERDVGDLCRALDAELPGNCGPHVSFVDARRLEDVDRAAFDRLVAHMRVRSADYDRNATRQALVRPPGVVGAVVAGFWQVAPAVHPEHSGVFSDPFEALRWLGRRDGEALLARLDRLHGEVSGTPRVVQVVRDHVAARNGRVSLAEVARALGVAPRTLQAQLTEAGTAFRDEVNAARLRAAMALLATTAGKLTAIAYEVGYSSPQQFSTAFRRATGLAPSAWRARQRRPGD